MERTGSRTRGRGARPRAAPDGARAAAVDGGRHAPVGTDAGELGLDRPITRRDFLNGVLVGAGALGAGSAAAAASSLAPRSPGAPATAAAFDGPSGTGDYARANGNTWDAIAAAHAQRDRAHGAAPARQARDTGEHYELVVVGGGAAGIAAAWYHARATGGRGRCLVLENHAVFGGEARRNEFEVDGVRLLAPQGSNSFFLPARPGDGYLHEEFEALGVPREFEYAPLAGTDRPLEFDPGNYMYLWSCDQSESLGLFLDDPVFGRSQRWLRNPWVRGLRGLGVPEALRRELLRWREGLVERRAPGPALDRALDATTYRDYLLREHGLPPQVADWTEPFVASGVGLGASVVSAYTATRLLGLPGIDLPGAPRPHRSLADFPADYRLACFPGGNSALLRAFLAQLVPEALPARDFAEVVGQPIRFEALDRPGAPTRVRLSATVVDVRPVAGGPTRVRLTYAQDGALHAVEARAVVMAAGAWVNRHVVHELPAAHRAALESFRYSSMLVANVALTNWRFLERLGLTSCLYTGGEFGFSCNLARPMHLRGHAPPLDPGRPAVLTFYAPVLRPGLDARAQGAAGRAEVLTTAFAEYERRIRAQLVRLFGPAGFDPARDVAALTLNRWGHAYVVPEPGFHFGRDGAPPAADVLRENVGPIAFAAAELRGLQSFRGAVYEARRAVEQVLPFATGRG